MRTWTRLVPAVLLALPFTVSSLHADAETNAKKIEQLQKDVEQIRKDIESLRNDVKNSSARGAKVAEDLQDIKSLLRDMAKKQEALTLQPGYDPRSVMPGVPGGVIPRTGTITLQNVFSTPATVRINDKSYFIEANRTRIVPSFPVGPFQYSVNVEGFGTILPPRTETLPPAGFRIRIFPTMPY